MSAMPAALHSYLTDELYRSAPESLRRHLVQLALAVDLKSESLEVLFGLEGRSIVEQAMDLGFLSPHGDEPELHPLFREYLLAKVEESRDATELIEAAIDASVKREQWERVFDLIRRFRRLDLVEPILNLAYRPLIRSGRFGTLAAFTAGIRAESRTAHPILDLAEAEIALRDGSFELASRIADRARSQLAANDPLISRANAIIGQNAFVQGDLLEAESAYRTAYEVAQTDEDMAEALRGWALATVQGERPDSQMVVERLAVSKNSSPLDLVRFATVELARRHFADGFVGALPDIEDASQAAPRVEDPRVRSSFRFFAGYVLAVGTKYQAALDLMDLADEDIEAYDLDFARPHSLWNRALISLGQRRFGATERLLRLFEDSVARKRLGYHVLNGRILRARLALQTGRSVDALQWLPVETRESAIPSIRGEYVAMRALAFGALGDAEECLRAANEAEEITSAVEVRVLLAAARAIVTKSDIDAAAMAAWSLADELGAWDPLIAAIRASPALADALASLDGLRSGLAELYEQTNDLGLGRRAGLRLRATRNPDDVLTPREMEVLGLLAQGLRNRDVSEALVISPSTTKVHVRNILEKLGVRTRAEAVARLGGVS